MNLARCAILKWIVSIMLLGWSLSSWALLVAWQPGAGYTELQTITSNEPPIEGRSISEASYHLMHYPIDDMDEKLVQLAHLRHHPDVVFAELNTRLLVPASVHSARLSATPAGLPYFWPWMGLDLVQQWPCDAITLAIIDSGVDIDHPDLLSEHFLPSLRTDQQPVIPADAIGHGTHIAGLIAGRPNTQQGTLGLCSSARLWSIGVLSPFGGNLADAITAIDQARLGQAQIINASWGTTRFSQALFDALQRAEQAGMLIVAAAGNDRQALHHRPYYPAQWSGHIASLISVANADQPQRLYAGPSGSNFSRYYVDLAAPGTSIRSTWLNQDYRAQTGTSMSAPFVSAAAAALWHDQPDLSATAVKAAVLNSVRYTPALVDDVRYPGLLQIDRLLLGPVEQVIRPAWFSYQWLSEGERLLIRGHALDQVVRAEWHENAEQKLLPFVEVQQGLELRLPTEWQTGVLHLYDLSGPLMPLELQRAEHHIPHSWCEAGRCRLPWQRHQIEIERLGGRGHWTAHLEKDGASLALRGEDLRGDWQFILDTQQHWRWSALEIWDPHVQRWQRLESRHGLDQPHPGLLRWALADASPWLQTGNTWQTLHLRPVLSPGLSGGEGCYIATLVYGDAEAEQVQQLRAFRDQQLMHSATGRWLVHQYYRWSPWLVETLAPYPRLQSIVRFLLDLLVDWLRR
ncbi:S8 family serine peptidase [Marinospirillum sp. MEB164]|uniref:S8 family serine peptidase n=1 Tax=Marinospirillum alkalitolerans TaxID=3123374 RepID=A0ABW8PX66_9GAMM